VLLSLSRRQKAVLSVSLVLILLAPGVLAMHDEQTVITGHTTFYNGEAYDGCMASIAGILRTTVRWFNDMVLAERYAGKGTYIYVTERGAQDPTPASGRTGLYTEGVSYTFTDPNGVPWTVQEAFMFEDGIDVAASTKAPDPLNSGDYSPHVPSRNEIAGMVSGNRTYVWIVELSAVPVYDMFHGADPQNAHTYYNFVTLIDTCKMHDTKAQPPVVGEPDHYNVTHDTPTELGTEHGHPAGATAHAHQAKLADLWTGGATKLIPLPNPQDPAGGAMSQTAWTTGEASQQATGNRSAQPTPTPVPPTP
jgi:hypothetical protein